MEITDAVIVSHEQVGSGSFPYASYTVNVKFADQETPPTTIHRRFNDFKWLYNSLREELPAYIIPPLPKADFYSSYAGKFNPDLIEMRKKYLNIFLRRIIESKPLRDSLSFETFINCFDPPHMAAKIYSDNDNSLLGFASSITSKIYHRYLELPPGITSVKLSAKKRHKIFDNLAISQHALEECSQYVTNYILMAADCSVDLASVALDLSIPRPTSINNKTPTLYLDIQDIAEILNSELKSFKYVKEVACACADLSSYKSKIEKERQNAILMKPKSGIINVLKSPFIDAFGGKDDLSTQKVKILEMEVRLAELNDALAKGKEEFKNASNTIISEDKSTSESTNNILKSSIISYCADKVAFHESLYNYWISVVKQLSPAA